MANAILIFGAGLNQLTLIKAAKELDLVSIVLDPNENAPGRELGDYFYCVSGNDYEATKEIAVKHKVSGMVTSQMEKPLRLMARLAKELGYIFNSPAVIERSLDKYLMKKTFLRNDVPCAAGLLFESGEEITSEKLGDLKYPLMMKPKDATSSQGVFKINDFGDIKKYLPISRSFSKTNEIIIEEFLDGAELSVEAVTFEGKTTIVQFTEKFITPFPRTVEMGHLQPATLKDTQKRKVSEVVIDAITAIGIYNSASHTEIKLTKEGPRIVEIGARLGGDFIASYLTLHSCGVNMDKAAIQVALGIKPELIPTLNQYSYIKYFELPASKKVKEIRNWKEIFNDPDVIFANVAVKPGDIIPDLTDSAKRSGFVILKDISKKNILEKAKVYIKQIQQCIVLN